jgi:hypothetical protein
MRKTYLFLFVIVVAITNSNAQPYQIGHTTITFIDASRRNRCIATEIYEKWDSMSCKLHLIGIWICINVSKGEQKPISIGSGRKGMEETQITAQKHQPKNRTSKTGRTYCQDKRSATKMVKLFSGNEHYGQTTGFRWLA